MLLTFHRIGVADALVEVATPYEQAAPSPTHRILILGDSTAVGVGAAQQHSVAARLGSKLPQAQITNRAVSGWQVADLEQVFRPGEDERYDLILIHIGANDVLQATPIDAVRRDLRTVLQRARQAGDMVVHISSGDIGDAPIFLPPAGYVLSQRTKQYREVFLETNQEAGTHYVDIYHLEQGDTTAYDPTMIFAADGLHPGKASYHFWFDSIVSTMGQAGFEFPQTAIE